VHPRVRFALILGFACSFALLAALWLAAFKQAGSKHVARGDSFYGSVRPPDATVPAFTLTDQDGKRVTAASLRGRPTVYAFIYSHCQDICPLEVQQIRGALDRLGRDLQVVGVSVDPINDTKDSARAFLIKQHMTGRMRYLLGSRAALQPVWDGFGIQPQLDGLDHSAYVVVADSRGRQRLGYPSSQLSVEGLADDLAKLG
jgi:protein SCO1